jgi:DNA-binding transcriptional MocR family regulator
LYGAFPDPDLVTRILSGEWEPGAGLPRMTDLARRYGVNRGTVVRHGMSRPRRPRGNLVKRNAGTGEPGYSFTRAASRMLPRLRRRSRHLGLAVPARGGGPLAHLMPVQEIVSVGTSGKDERPLEVGRDLDFRLPFL